MTCLNPNAHHITVTGSQYWAWVVGSRQSHLLSSAARKRARWLQWHTDHGRNVIRTCRHFGVARPTFYRWQRRFDQHGLPGLDDRSHRPRRVRQRQWTTEQAQRVLLLRESYPRWGKAKLTILLCRDGLELSCSMVGRILRELRASGRLNEGLRPRRPGHRPVRPYGRRKPKDYVVTAPGDLVQIDTKDVRPVPGVEGQE